MDPFLSVREEMTDLRVPILAFTDATDGSDYDLTNHHNHNVNLRG